jgi:hypothetical protein
MKLKDITIFQKKPSRQGIILSIASVLVLAAVVGGWQANKSGRTSSIAAPVAAQTANPGTAATTTPLSSVATTQSQAAPQSLPTVTATVRTHSSAAANAVQIQLEYPADKLTVQSVAGSDAFPVTLASDSSQPGVIKLARGAALGSDGVSGDNNVVTITFAQKPGASGPYAISVDKPASGLAKSDDQTNLLATGDGDVTVTVAQ